LANGAGQDEILMERDPTAPPLTLLSPQGTPDSHYLLHLEENGPSGARLSALSLNGDKKSFDIVQARFPQGRIFQFRVFPNGRWLVYSSTDSGTEEVYVTHFPDGKADGKFRKREAATPHGGPIAMKFTSSAWMDSSTLPA
jgi:hypothetical protein